jgi:hypothetical protein
MWKVLRGNGDFNCFVDVASALARSNFGILGRDYWWERRSRYCEGGGRLVLRWRLVFGELTSLFEFAQKSTRVGSLTRRVWSRALVFWVTIRYRILAFV